MSFVNTFHSELISPRYKTGMWALPQIQTEQRHAKSGASPSYQRTAQLMIVLWKATTMSLAHLTITMMKGWFRMVS